MVMLLTTLSAIYLIGVLALVVYTGRLSFESLNERVTVMFGFSLLWPLWGAFLLIALVHDRLIANET